MIEVHTEENLSRELVKIQPGRKHQIITLPGFGTQTPARDRVGHLLQVDRTAPASGAMLLPGKGKSPLGCGRAVPSGMKFEDKEAGLRGLQNWVDHGNRIAPQLLLVIYEEPQTIR